MNVDEFRRIALMFEGATEGAHHGHADFRVRGRVFASLGYPDTGWGMVKLTPDQQRTLTREHPEAFVPVTGTWGQRGSTNVRLDAVDEESLGEALTLAWQNIVRPASAGVAAKRQRARRSRGRSPDRRDPDDVR